MKESGVAIVARGACSSLGEGEAAFFAGRDGEQATTLVARDEELVAAGLRRPFCARASLSASHSPSTTRDRATVLLEHALAACAAELDVALPNWRASRVGAAIGTSSGGMRSFEALFGENQAHENQAHGVAAQAATYIGPVVDALPILAGHSRFSIAPIALVLAACASSTIALGLARAWLLEDRCDVVLCGGFDAVSVFVAAGFESLRATCSERGPRPFRVDRDGLALGEGAAIVALAPMAAALANNNGTTTHARGWITGFGASCDATHLTAPDPKGEGLASAATAALADAGQPAIALISAHGTATPQNDTSEALAIAKLASSNASLAARSPVFAFKGTIGHTLGAAGVLELLATIDALDRKIAPASAGEGAAEPGVTLHDRATTQPESNDPSRSTSALKLSSAFGGANAALVVSVNADATTTTAECRAAHISRAVAVTLSPATTDPAHLASITGYATDRIARADDLVRLAIAAVAKLEDTLGGRGVLRGAGIVVGHGLATIETNARFLARMKGGGAKRAEPRRFPYTTPNAPAGECAVAFGLTGPAFAVGGGPHGGIEALLVAASLVRTGVVDRIVVVAVDEAGEATARIAPGTTSGAVALAMGFEPSAESKANGRAIARLEECSVRFDVPSKNELEASPETAKWLRPSHAHAALLPLVDGHPDEISAEVSGDAGGFAKARFFWL